MAGIGSYVAAPKKRLSAAFVDLLLIGLAAVIVFALEDAFGYRPDYGALVALAYFGYHALFLQFWSGQTPGRRAFDIIVIPSSGGALSMTQILLRSALRPVVVLLPTAASLKAGMLELNPMITTIALVVEVALMYLIPSRRTVTDFVSRCIVVNAPPPQPHRAPAVPMYSATDGEFGYPPRQPADGKDWERYGRLRVVFSHTRFRLQLPLPIGRNQRSAAERYRPEGILKEALMLHRPGTFAFIAALLLQCAAPLVAADEDAPPGCRLDANDPLRAEVDQMMKQGEEYEQQQRLALEEKVGLLARARGWNKRDEHEYMVAVMREGVRETWNPTLAVASAFMRICEQSAGNQRAEAVRLFRELYVLDERQWQSMHHRVDSEIAAAGREPKN